MFPENWTNVRGKVQVSEWVVDIGSQFPFHCTQNVKPGATINAWNEKWVCAALRNEVPIPWPILSTVQSNFLNRLFGADVFTEVFHIYIYLGALQPQALSTLRRERAKSSGQDVRQCGVNPGATGRRNHTGSAWRLPCGAAGAFTLAKLPQFPSSGYQHTWSWRCPACQLLGFNISLIG